VDGGVLYLRDDSVHLLHCDLGGVFVGPAQGGVLLQNTRKGRINFNIQPEL